MTPEEKAEPAHADGREFLARVLISEGASLLVAVGMLWYLGPGRLLINGVVHQLRARLRQRGNYIDREAARFSAEISRYDHEQAARSDHPSAGGGCNCDGG